MIACQDHPNPIQRTREIPEKGLFIEMDDNMNKQPVQSQSGQNFNKQYENKPETRDSERGAPPKRLPDLTISSDGD